jgi:hypothetical protein
MDLSDSLSSTSSSSPPPPQTKSVARRGRPRLTEDAELAKLKRRAQLRDAQRGLRERKNRHLEELQARVAELEQENSTLKNNVEFLTTFTYPSFEKPIAPWPMDFTAGSLAYQDPSFAQVSLTYDYDKFVSELLNPLTIQNTLNEQTFVRTLNALCLTHALQILILDPPNSESLQQKFGNPLKVSSPAVIASRIAARLVHMVLDGKVKSAETVPWVDTDIAPWRLSDDMLELTPRDVWGFLKSHPNFNDVDIRAFYQSVVDKSYCSGFGPVISTSDVRNALVRSLKPSLSFQI